MCFIVRLQLDARPSGKLLLQVKYFQGKFQAYICNFQQQNVLSAIDSR